MNRFRERLVWLSVVVTLASIVALLIVANFAPDPKEVGRWNFSDTYYPVITGFIGSVFSIGALSILLEIAARKSYADDLNGFLQLKAALVKSGLVDIEAEPPHSPSEKIQQASRITAVVRDPQRWVQRNFDSVLDAAKNRSVEIELLMPDPDSPNFDSVALSIGYEPEDLRRNYDLAIDWIQQRWNATEVRDSSTITISTVSMPLFELMVLDKTAIFSVGRTLGHKKGEAQLSMTFEKGAYPVDWLGQQLDEASRSGAVWAKVGPA